jgi:hypothetical protein
LTRFASSTNRAINSVSDGCDGQNCSTQFNSSKNASEVRCSSALSGLMQLRAVEDERELREWVKDFDDPARDEWQLPSRGYFTVRLAKSPAAATVYAVDIEPSMVEYVRQRAAREGLKNVVTVQAGADRTNLPEPVDLVLVVVDVDQPRGDTPRTGPKGPSRS